ncbi:hypothetical protein V2J09_017848 [Rumex salicifolius]
MTPPSVHLKKSTTWRVTLSKFHLAVAGIAYRQDLPPLAARCCSHSNRCCSLLLLASPAAAAHCCFLVAVGGSVAGSVLCFLKGLVLLIILISGLCCMMDIDTPTRYEAPQDS